MNDASLMIPRWLEEAVFYQIFPERFANADPTTNPPGVEPWGGTPTRDNFFGGDLRGIVEHLDHVASLGANTLYLTPVFTAGTNHRYDGEDYFHIDPVLGGDEAFTELVSAVHERGMRIVLDGVFNHCGWHHPYFVDVVEKGADSPYVNWFYIEDYPVRSTPELTYLTCSGCEYLPKWNVHNPQVRRHHLDVMLHWLEQGIDGWRLDVPYFVHDGFWRDVRRVVKARFPEACLIGEEWENPTKWLHGDMFDGTMNYGVRNYALDFVVRRSIDGGQAHARIADLDSSIPPHARAGMMNLVGSHDTPRLMTECGGSLAKVTQVNALMVAYPGAPMVYYGDEVGMRGENDPGCRGCMLWEPSEWNMGCLEATRALLAARAQLPALGRGSVEVPYAVGDVLSVRTRVGRSGALTLINRSVHPTVIPHAVLSHAVREVIALVDGAIVDSCEAQCGDGIVLPGQSVRIVEEEW